MARRSKITKRSSPASPDTGEPEVERYVVWQNLSRSIEEVDFGDGHVVKDWVPLREVSVPERFTAQCEKLGLKRLRYANQ